MNRSAVVQELLDMLRQQRDEAQSLDEANDHGDAYWNGQHDALTTACDAAHAYVNEIERNTRADSPFIPRLPAIQASLPDSPEDDDEWFVRAMTLLGGDRVKSALIDVLDWMADGDDVRARALVALAEAVPLGPPYDQDTDRP